MLKSFFVFILELIKIVVISLVIIMPVRYFLIQPFYVKGASMEPNFHDSEYLIIDEISYRIGDPERGDIIVFRYPRNPQEFFIKRLIALPGEEVQIREGKVKIFNDEFPDGVELSESYLKENTKTYGSTAGRVVVGEDQYFVLGDNRNSSKDSRNFGAVDKSYLTGKVLLRGWPFDKFQVFKGFEYSY